MSNERQIPLPLPPPENELPFEAAAPAKKKRLINRKEVVKLLDS